MAHSSTAQESREQRRRFYLEPMRIRWSAMSARQRRRFKRRYPVLAISLDHLVGEDLIPPRASRPPQGDDHHD